MADYLEIYDLNYSRLCILNDNTINSARDIKVESKINAIEKLTFTLPLSSDKWSYVINENLVKWKGQYYFIKLPTYTHSVDEKIVTIECLHLSSSLQSKLCSEITELDGVGQSAEILMDIVLEGTGWERLTIDDEINVLFRDLVVKEQSAFSNLVKIAEKFEGFLEFDSSTKRVNLLRKKTDRNIQIRKGKNLKSIDVEYDSNEIVTRLFAFGGDDPETGIQTNMLGATLKDEQGNIIYKIDENGQQVPALLEHTYIEDYSYYLDLGYDLTYINNHPELFLRESTWDASEYLDNQLLYEDAVKKLKTLSTPKVNCSIEGVDLSVFPEYFIQTPILGELITIIDEDLKIRLQVKVVGITKNYDNPLDMKVELSDTIEYSNIISSLLDTSNTVQKSLNATGNVKGSYIQGVLDILKTKLNSTTSKWYTDDYGNIIFVSLDGSKCMKLGSGIFGIANSKDVDGNWNFKTFGDGDGFTADQIVTGILRGGVVEWNLDDTPRDIKDANGNKLYTLPSGAFLIGNSITDYKLYFDGTSLKFGNGSISWSNLDTTSKQNIGSVTVSITGGTRSFNFDSNGNNQTSITAYGVSVTQNGASVVPTVYSWSCGGVLSSSGKTTNASTFTPAVSTYSAIDTWVQVIVTVNGNTYTERIPIAISKSGSSGTNGIDSYSIILSNDSVNIPTDSSGGNAVLTGATTTVYLYKGSTLKTPTIGTLTCTNCTASVSSSVITINSVTSDTGYIDIPVSDGGTSVGTKRFSFAKSKQGSKGDTGASGIIGVLSNETCTVPANSSGTVSDFSVAVSTLTIYNGIVDDTANWTITQTLTNVTVTASGTPANRTATITALSADSGSVKFTATRTGYGTITKTFTITKNKQGANGNNATSYWLVADSLAISKSISGVYTPASINITGKSQTGTGTPTNYPARFVIAETTDGTSYTDKYTSTADEATKSYTPSSGIKALRVRMYLSGGTTTLLDEQNIPIVNDGTNGTNGKTYILNVLNGVRSISYDASGGNPNPSTSTAFSVTLYENGVSVTPVTYSWSANGSLSGTSTNSTFIPTIATVYTGNNSYISVYVTYNGNTISQVVPISVVKDASGVDWVNDWTTGATAINGSKVVTPRVFAGSNSGTSTAPNLTGIAIGKDVMNGQEDNIGIVAYKNNNVTFQVDVGGNVTIGMAGKRQIKIDSNGNAVIPTITASDVDSNFGASLPISTNPALTNKADNSAVKAVNDKVDGNINDVKEIKTYFDFKSTGLLIGKSDSPLNINISNSEMDFIDNGKIVAYVNGQKMYISTLEVLNSLVVGVHKIEKYNDNITLIKWVGGNN